MKKTILSIFAIGVCLSGSYAEDTINWQENINQSYTQTSNLKERGQQIVKIDILMSKFTSVANDTMQSLEKNYDVLRQLESNTGFRNCAISKDNLKKMQTLKLSAKELLNTREITQSQYDGYIGRLKDSMKEIEQKITTHCKNKG